MHRRELILGGAILTAGMTEVIAGASAATPQHAPTNTNNRAARLTKFRFKPGGRKIWEDWCAEIERRRKESVATLQAEGVRTESCYLSEDGEGLYYFEDVPDYGKSLSVFEHSPRAIDAEFKAKFEQCLEKVGELKTLFELHNPSMS
jgi:Family of unknown function (DUF6176)